jgi:hypothetical protein
MVWLHDLECPRYASDFYIFVPIASTVACLLPFSDLHNCNSPSCLRYAVPSSAVNLSLQSHHSYPPSQGPMWSVINWSLFQNNILYLSCWWFGWLVTTKGGVQSQVRSCGIAGGQCDTVTGVSPSTQLSAVGITPPVLGTKSFICYHAVWL